MFHLMFSLRNWISPPSLQCFFFKGHIPSVKDLLAQVLGMCSADGLQCHFLRGLFHWQRATNLKSHPVSVWSTSNDWLIWGYKSLVISVQNVTSLTSHFSYRAASRSAEVIVGLHYNLTSPSVPFCVLPFPFSSVHPKGLNLLHVKLWCSMLFCAAQSLMHGFKSSHEPFQFVYGFIHFGRASGVDGCLGIISYMIRIHLALKNILN